MNKAFYPVAIEQDVWIVNPKTMAPELPVTLKTLEAVAASGDIFGHPQGDGRFTIISGDPKSFTMTLQNWGFSRTRTYAFAVANGFRLACIGSMQEINHASSFNKLRFRVKVGYQNRMHVFNRLRDDIPLFLLVSASAPFSSVGRGFMYDQDAVRHGVPRYYQSLDEYFQELSLMRAMGCIDPADVVQEDIRISEVDDAIEIDVCESVSEAWRVELILSMVQTAAFAYDAGLRKHGDYIEPYMIESNKRNVIKSGLGAQLVDWHKNTAASVKDELRRWLDDMREYATFLGHDHRLERGFNRLCSKQANVPATPYELERSITDVVRASVEMVSDDLIRDQDNDEELNQKDGVHVVHIDGYQQRRLA
jgi:hypothetical protein